MLQRLESGLQIALQRGSTHDARRLLNLIEAVEREAGVEHVRVLRDSTPLDRLYRLSREELEQRLAEAVRRGDRYAAEQIEDVLTVRLRLTGLCPSCGGSGRWGDDIPCGRRGGVGTDNGKEKA